jgi:hypothetical protein
VAVCAPGVAITSSVPANNYAVWDGTSMAAPHITGLAALVLAHHPDFQGAYAARGAARVERLFQIIKASARSINFGEPGRTGFGLPDVMVAVGLQPPSGQSIGQLSAQQNTLNTLMAIPEMARSIMAQAGPTQFNPQMAQAWLNNNVWGQAGYPVPSQMMGMMSAFGPGYSGYIPMFMH